MKKNVIIQIEKESIAEEIGVEKGDILLEINGQAVKDVFDYRFLIADEYIEVLIEKPDGEEWLLEVEKEENEDLGIVFETGLMDQAKSCKNKCIFCFIDQLPKNMRETLYFKDDDSRLSFLQGNYVTLTNMSEEDIKRILYYHLSPINVSVHATDPILRTEMLKNPNAKNIMKVIQQFNDAGISMNFQIVLCKGVNDGAHLDKSIEDLSQIIPNGKSLSIVPVGISKYRDGLHQLAPFNKEDSLTVIAQTESWQQKLKKQYGTNFVYIADEFYINAEVPVPDYKVYEDFPQIENGVGMIALMKKEFQDHFKKMKFKNSEREVSIATGKASYEFILSLTNQITTVYPNTKINVFPIENEFFGEHITVSGLMTGTDIMNQLKNRVSGKKLLIPQNALRSDTEILLDDTTLKTISQNLNINVEAVESTAIDFITACLYN